MTAPRSVSAASGILALLLACQPLWAQPQGGSGATQSIIRYDRIHHPEVTTGGMVVSQNALASEVGRRILLAGGNAVDASVAMGFALAVTLPRAGNLGGSGFMLVYMVGSGGPEDVLALDFRSAAPAAARSEDLRDGNGEIRWDELTFGPRAAAVPGTVAGLEEAWRRFGSLPWHEVLAPAIELAENGIEVSTDLAFALSEALTVMRDSPSSMAAYARADGSAYAAGETLIQPDLAWSLREISEHGAEAFYGGAIARKIVGYMEQAKGLISATDLGNYRVRVRQAIATDYRGYRVVTVPPSSAGGLALLQMLNVLGHFDLRSLPQGSAASMHLLAETMKLGNANRREGIGDSDFVEVPIAGILSADIARDMAERIDPDRAMPVAEISPMNAFPYESRDTTHFSVVDDAGNAVSTTYTLGHSFGSGAVVPGTGIILDNQMRNFSFRDPDVHANRLEPGKRVASTMTPTMVFDEKGELFLVTGTPGGSRIHSVILQVIVNAVDYGMNIAEATHAPRIYQAWREPELGVESGVSADSLRLLEALGHEIEVQQTMGSTQSIMLRDGLLHGAADPRRPGALALGVDATRAPRREQPVAPHLPPRGSENARPQPLKTTQKDPAPERVLFVGNSYFYYNDSLHNHVSRMIASLDPELGARIKFKSATIGGAALSHHPIGSHLTPGSLGIDEPFELVILQGGSGEPLSDRRRREFARTAAEFEDRITAAGGETALYMTHAYRPPHDRYEPGMIELIETLYVETANEIGALVIPVGLAFEEAYRRRPDIVLHKRFDGSHPGLLGTYLAASVVVASVWELSPVGSSYDYFGTVSEEDARFLQQVAQDVVEEFQRRLLSERDREVVAAPGA